jgi:[citrate (pro-3S)-lyase] ligase
MNANPFTLGHQYLVEQASASCDTLHLFIVSEDLSLVPFSVRRRLVEEGTAYLNNVVLHDCGPYIISSATFPSYFLKDETAVIEGQARLDLAVFKRIAEVCGITARWAGEEPASQVTGLYNRIMAEELPKAGIKFCEIPRREADGAPVSASKVRLLLRDGNFEALKDLLPVSTLEFFRSPEAEPVLERIRAAEEVVHY